MTSNVLAHRDEALQAELALARSPAAVSVPLEMIWRQKSQGAAFTLACSSSGLEDKEIYLAMKIDAGTFSRMKAGTNTLANDRMAEFCDLVGNTIYPEWIAYQLGRTLVVIKTEAERRAEAAERRAAEAEAENRLMRQLLGRPG